MPWKTEDVDSHIKGLDKSQKGQWVAVANSIYDKCLADGGDDKSCAPKAIEQANGVVTKEAMMANKDTLQAKYAEIIQEVGKRNAAADADRIKKIVALCQELLSSEEQDVAKTTEAIKECDATLTWLKEQKVVKTEDGTSYPAEAFAYVPDTEKPSEWKLRLWEDPEKKVTRAQLGRAAAALSPGGFRGQKVEIPSADLASVKRKIRGEYRKLDVADEDIPKWVKESESRELLADYMPLAEAKYANGEALITVIKPGFNATKARYYPQEVLARDFGIFEGVKMYANHPTPTEEKERPERDIRNWVATLGKPFIDKDGSVRAKAQIVEPWMQERLAILRDKNMLQEMGVSINAVGSATKAEIQGVKTNYVERLIRARSVDFVTEPGAGGMVNVYESVDPSTDIDLVDVAQLKERRPDIIRLIESEIEGKTIKEAKHKMALEEKVTELEKQVVTLTEEKTKLETKITEADKAKAKAEAQAIIKEAVGKADLPDAAKERILGQFKEAEKADGIAEAIKAEGDYIAKLTEVGKVRGLGGSQPSEEASKKNLREAGKRLHPEYTEAQLDIFVTGR